MSHHPLILLVSPPLNSLTETAHQRSTAEQGRASSHMLQIMPLFKDGNKNITLTHNQG